jgi:L-ascorbate metabolism protein UlaG (beta-lactamase superfamily)
VNVTKYPQSCLLLEKDDGRIIIDPGSIAMDRYDIREFGELDAVLYTHRHHDHYDERIVKALLDGGVALYGNADVCALVPEMQEVRHAEPLGVAGFAIEPVDLPHVPMVDGSPGPPNTGFIIDGAFFHPGDGIELEDRTASVVALPIAGPSISFRDAYAFAQRLRAETVIPMHYDHFIADPAMFARYCDIADVVVLGPGESRALP